MIDLNAYLERIGYKGTREPSLDNLRLLHLAHVSAVPFENLDVHYQQWITLDTDKFYNKIVGRKRGGFCYELNGLLLEALQQLGFQTYFISGSVYIPSLDTFGPYFAHVAIIVEQEDNQWLVDVGFGSSFPEPLKIDIDKPQEQDGIVYVLRKINEEEILIDRSYDKGNSFTPMYKFTMTPRRLEDFQEMCIYHQTSEQSPLYQKKLCSIATPRGRITLTSNHLIITEDGNRTEQEVTDEQDFREKLFQHFHMKVPS